MTDHAIAGPLARSPRVTALAVGLSSLAGVVVSLVVLALLGGGGGSAAPERGTFTSAGEQFTLAVPAGWRALDRKQLAAVPSHPLAVLRRADSRGTVVVRPTAPVRARGVDLARTLGRQLRQRFPGFQPVSARFAQVRGGRAFVYTFVHGRNRTVQTLALTGARGRAYAIDAVAPGDAPDAARQIGAIVASFGP